MDQTFFARLRSTPGGPTVGDRGVPASEVVSRLEAGAGWSDIGRSLAIEAADILAAVAGLTLGRPEDDSIEGPPLVRATPGRPGLRSALSAPAMAEVVPDRLARLALAAGLLQVHDFWDASHAAAQEADDSGESDHSAYWHGIAHRREPDPGNAAYWFRRVGRHPILGPLGAEAAPLLGPAVRAGPWNPTTLTALAGRARPGTDDETLALRLQRLEMIHLLAATAATAGLR